MKLRILLAVCAISSAAKLDRTYLPSPSVGSAGGSPGSLQAPSGSGAFSQGRGTPSNGPAFFGIANSSPKYGATSPQIFGGSISLQQGYNKVGVQGSRGPTGSSKMFAGANLPSQGLGGVNIPSQRFSGANSPFQVFNGQSQRFPRPSPSNQGISGASNSQRFPGSNTPSQEFEQIINGGFNAPSQGLNSANGPSEKYNTPQGLNAGAAPYIQSERAQAAQERSAQILRQDFQNDGYTFAYNFETSNGILAEESGVATNGVQAQGAFSYIGDDGQLYSVAYTADENGYQPSGDHLPTPPPIPDAILRSIELNRANSLDNSREGAHNEQLHESPQQYKAPSSPASPRKQYGASQQYTSQQPEYQDVAEASFPRPGGFAQTSVPPQYNVLKQQYATPTQGSPQLNNILSQLQYNPSSQEYNPSSQQYNGPTQQNNGHQGFSGSKQYNPRTSVPSRQDAAPQGSPQQYDIPQGASQQYNAPRGSQQYNAPRGTSQQYNSGQQNAVPSHQYNLSQGSTGQREAAPSQQRDAPASRAGKFRQQFSGAPYSYNPPAAGSPPQPGAGAGEAFHYNPLATQTFNGNAGAASAGVRPNVYSPAAAGLSAARQPPSFSQQEGYKY